MTHVGFSVLHGTPLNGPGPPCWTGEEKSIEETPAEEPRGEEI